MSASGSGVRGAANKRVLAGTMAAAACVLLASRAGVLGGAGAVAGPRLGPAVVETPEEKRQREYLEEELQRSVDQGESSTGSS